MSRKKDLTREIAKVLPTFLKRIHSGQMEKIEIPPAQMSMIMILADQQKHTVGELSSEMKVSAPTVTGIVDRLQRSKLVRRKRDAKDRRVVHIILTAKGLKESKHLQKAFMQRWGVIASILSIKDQESYIMLLKKVIRGIDAKVQEKQK